MGSTRVSCIAIALTIVSSKPGPRIGFGRWRSKPSNRGSPSSKTQPAIKTVTSTGSCSHKTRELTEFAPWGRVKEIVHRDVVRLS